MRSLLIHLSDIHIGGNQDRVLLLAPAISRASATLEPPADRVIVLVTGDIANTGSDDEYALAIQFFESLHTALVADVGCMPGLVAILPLPGNHDCDFRSSQVVREMVLSKLTAADDLRTPDVSDVLSKPQEPYRRFVHDLRNKGLCPAPSLESLLRTTYAIGSPPNQVVAHIYNTSMCSKKDESPSSLLFPPEEVASDEPDRYTLVVSAFHHPYHWIRQDIMRAFRTAVERSSDLILTGHDHVPSKRHTELETGETINYIEGALLQDRKSPGVSGFHAVVLNGASRKQLSAEFAYDRQQRIFKLSLPDGVSEPSWDDFPLNKQRTRNSFLFSDEHAEYLEDPGLQLTHGMIGDLHLTDVFVCPDLQEVVPSKNRQPQTIPGAKIIDSLRSKERVLLVGDECSGKTTLAKALCLAFHTSGDLPLLIQSADELCSAHASRRCLREAIAKQYHPNLVSAYEQSEKQRRVLILDDFDRLGLSPEQRDKALLSLESYFGRIILLANEISLTLRDLLTQYSERYPQYRIQGFGYLHRNDLVDKWLAKYPAQDAASLARRTVEVSRTLDEVFGRGGVPPYPVYILAVLQASDASMPVNTNIGTHGYYYELLIRAELVRSMSNRDTDVLLAYLAFIAYKFFTNNLTEIPYDSYREFHAEYQKTYAIDIDVEEILKTLCERRMLERRNDILRFKYKYVFQYFVAHYLADHLRDSDAQESVRNLVARVYRRDCADTLLFLAHQTRDAFLIDTLTNEAAKHFPSLGSIRRLIDVSIPGDMEEVADRVAYEERDIREARREIASSRDRANETALVRRADEWVEVFEPLRQLMGGLHTMQIVGQVLKNFPGRLEAGAKLSLASAAYGIGMRAWRAIYNELSTNREDIAREMIDAVLRHDPSASRSALSTRAQNLVRMLNFLCGFGMVKRVADALGSADLGGTYANILEAEENNEIARLVQVAIKLDHHPTIPEGEVKQLFGELKDSPLGKWIIQQMALNHFQLFFVDHGTKQRLCAALDIEYRPRLGTGVRTKLLEPLHSRRRKHGHQEKIR